MKTFQKNTGLSRDQIEALLMLGGWECIDGYGWYGFKRRGVEGVVYYDEDYPEDGIGYNAMYELEPGYDPENTTLQWRSAEAIGWAKLLPVLEYMMEHDIL